MSEESDGVSVEKYDKNMSIEKKLSYLSLKQLRKICRLYSKQYKIPITGKTKSELIEEMLNHLNIDKNNYIRAKRNFSDTSVRDLDNYKQLAQKYCDAGKLTKISDADYYYKKFKKYKDLGYFNADKFFRIISQERTKLNRELKKKNKAKK